MFASAQRPDQPEHPDLTLLLNRMRQGDRDAGEQAVRLVYSELHRIASREMRHEQPGHTLRTTALVHEAYLRFVAAGSLEIRSREHFFAIASRQMRRILVDHARLASRQKRGGGAVKLDIDQLQLAGGERSIADLVSLDEALNELERVEPRAAQVVELRHFGGYTDREVMDALSLSLSTVRRDWEFARAWLLDWMQRDAKNVERAPGRAT
ncbi:MAG: ECF-type sigma factor [Bryobacteraceae bacterium]|jgi:RNA polymerase sigma factor (TIGR02999 family)